MGSNESSEKFSRLRQPNSREREASRSVGSAGDDVTPGFVIFPRQGVRVKVEILETPAEQRRGLMGRTSLPEYAGALFWHGGPEQPSYWMRNCKIPLDLIFLYYDQVVGIFTMQPEDGKSYRIDRPSTAALEVAGGWSIRYDVQVGDKVVVSLA